VTNITDLHQFYVELIEWWKPAEVNCYVYVYCCVNIMLHMIC